MNPAVPLPLPANPTSAADAPAQAELPPSGDLVTVARLYNSLEAEMLRGCLAASDVPATLGDAQTIQTDTLLTHALGGIRLMVPASHAGLARRVVAAWERGEYAIDDLPADAAPAAAEPEPLSHVGMPRLTLLAIVGLAVVGVLVALGRANPWPH